MAKRLIQVANAEGLQVNEVNDCLVQNFCSLKLVWCEHPLVVHLYCALLTKFEASKLFILDVALTENRSLNENGQCFYTSPNERHQPVARIPGHVQICNRKHINKNDFFLYKK